MTTSNFGKDRDTDPFGLHLLPCSEPNNPIAVQIVVDKYMHEFKMRWKIVHDTPRLENALRASLQTLAITRLTPADLPLLLTNKDFRKRCIDAIPVTFANEWLRVFWRDYDELYVQGQLKYGDSILNKVLLFLLTDRKDTM